MLRRLIRHPAAQAALARLLGLYLSTVYRTTRWTLLGEEHLRAALRPEAGRGQAATAPSRARRWPLRGEEHLRAALRPEAGRAQAAIAAFWHENLPLMPVLWLTARRR